MAHIVIDARIINSTSGRYVERLLSYLERVNTDLDLGPRHTYTVLVPHKDLDYWKPKTDSFQLVGVSIDNYSLAEQTEFKRLIESLSPDLVHFCMPQQPVLYKGKTVTTFHDMTLVKTYNSDKNWLVFHAKQFVGKWVFKRVARKSTEVIAISEFTKKELIEFTGISEDAVTVTYEAGEVTTDRIKPFSSPFKQYILYVGQQSDYKNIKRLGDAHQELLKTNPELGLILAGKVNAGVRRNQAYFESKHYKNILFTDFVPDEELNWLYTHASAYVFPSLMEGFGLPGLEVMAHGTPLVSSNATCLPEIYGDAAHYFDPYDTKDIARAIQDVLTDEMLQRTLVTNGYNQIKKYSWKKMAEQTLAIYEKALAK